MESAVGWARENGLEGELDIEGPNLVRYSQRGHGWAFTLKEKNGRGRMATARLTSEGKRSLWNCDTRGTR